MGLPLLPSFQVDVGGDPPSAVALENLMDIPHTRAFSSKKRSSVVTATGCRDQVAAPMGSPQRKGLVGLDA